MKRTQEQIDEIESTLAHFSGTQDYHRSSAFSRFHYHTDGVQYLAESCGAFWLIDAIISHQGKNSVKREPFQVWTLNVGSKQANRTKQSIDAVLTCTDGNGRELVHQSIPYTDFPLGRIELYLENGSLDGENVHKILMLPNER